MRVHVCLSSWSCWSCIYTCARPYMGVHTCVRIAVRVHLAFQTCGCARGRASQSDKLVCVCPCVRHPCVCRRRFLSGLACGRSPGMLGMWQRPARLRSWLLRRLQPRPGPQRGRRFPGPLPTLCRELGARPDPLLWGPGGLTGLPAAPGGPCAPSCPLAPCMGNKTGR